MDHDEVGGMWRRAGRLRRLAVVAALALLVVYAVVSLAVAWVLTKGTHKALDIAPTSIAAGYQDVSFPSRVDHLTLRGWLFHAPSPNGRSVVFIHGWQDNRVDTNSSLWRKARDMVAHGYDALLFDLRSCGTSDGSTFTLATDEPRDVLGAYDFMLERGYDPRRMAVLGVSMGASSLIEAAPQLSRVGALISDSAFAQLRPLVEKELPKRSHLPGIPFNWSITTLAHLVFGIDPDLRPVDAVRALPQRAFLFIQATDDDFIPSQDGVELYRASGNPQSRLDLIPANQHTKEYAADPSRYMSDVYTFIDQQVG